MTRHYEGRLSHGRPYAAELSAQDQVTGLTIFFSRDGLDLSDASVAELVEREGLARLGPERATADAESGSTLQDMRCGRSTLSSGTIRPCTFMTTFSDSCRTASRSEPCDLEISGKSE